MPFPVNYRQAYSPYTEYVNGYGGNNNCHHKKISYFDFFKGFYGPPVGFYDVPYHGINDLSEQEGFNGYPKRGNRGFRGGRGRGGQRSRNTKNEKFVFIPLTYDSLKHFFVSTDAANTNNDQQEGENTTTTNNNNNNNVSKHRQRRQQRGTNDNGSGAEQQTDG